MDSQYPALFSANWTRPAYNLPRWFGINSIPDLSTFVVLTPEGSAVLPNLEPGQRSQVPVDWTINQDTLSVNPSALSAIFECLSYEMEMARISTLQVEGQAGCTAEASQPGHLWFIDTSSLLSSGLRPTSTTTTKIEVMLESGSYITVDRADSVSSLFYSGGWKWFYDQPYLCLFGPGLQQTITGTASGWCFVSSQHQWDRSSLVYLQQPVTSRWVPFYPGEIRDDGMLGVRGGPYNMRMVRPNAQATMDQLTVRVNNIVQTAVRTMVTDQLDDALTFKGLLRKPHDFLGELVDRSLNYSWVGRNQSRSSVQARLAVAFGQYTEQVLSIGSTGCVSYPSGFNLAIVPDVPLFDIWLETLAPDLQTSESFVTSVADYDLFQAYHNNVTETMIVSGSECSFDYTINQLTDRPEVLWLITNYSNTASGFTPTANFPSGQPLDLIFTGQVLLPDPSDDSKDEATKLSYLVRWKSQAISQDGELPELTGQACFL